MANQKSKIIDITQSYIPIDPQAFPETLGLTAKEDDPIKDMNIMAYEGYNFLPTSYGYRSYFSTATLMSFDALTTACDKLLSFQSKTYENMLVALCSDGVYVVKAGDTAWTKIWALTDTWVASSIYSQYTWTVIENTLHVYRQGAAVVLRIKDDLTNDTITPSFLNMAGQLGIFKANGSLAFWDSENSIAWSNVFDLTDFTPSVENLVGNTIFFGVQGRIVHVQDHGEGFVIYSTKSIVGVTYSGTSATVWDAGVVTSESGIAHPGAVTSGSTNQEHFVYTSTGIMKIGHYNALSRKYDAATILPELFDYLRESRSPVYLSCHAARFLYFSLVDDSYINGRTSFTDVAVPTLTAPVVTIDQAFIDSIVAEGFPLSGKYGYRTLDSFLRDPNGTLLPDYTATTYPMPKWVATSLGPNSSVAMSTKGYMSSISDLDDVFSTYADVHNASINHSTPWSLATVASLYQTQLAAAFFSVDTFNIYMSTARVTQPYDTTTYIQTGLYPGSDVPAGNSYGLSAWDSIYNFLASMDEEAELYDTARRRAIEEAALNNGATIVWEYYKATPPTITDLYPTPVVSYIPHKEYSVDFNMVKQSVDYAAAFLDVIASYNKYTRISWEGSTRSHVITDNTAADFPDYILTFDVYHSDHPYKMAVWGTIETAAQLNEYMVGKTLKSPFWPDIEITSFNLTPNSSTHTTASINGGASTCYFSMMSLRSVIGDSGEYESYQYTFPDFTEGNEAFEAAILNNHKIMLGEPLSPMHASLYLGTPNAASPGSLLVYDTSTNLDAFYPYMLLSPGIPLSMHPSIVGYTYPASLPFNEHRYFPWVTEAVVTGGFSLLPYSLTDTHEVNLVICDVSFKPATDIPQSPTWVPTYGSTTSNPTTFCKQVKVLSLLTREEAWADIEEAYKVTVTQHMTVNVVENIVYDPDNIEMTKVERSLRLTNTGVDTFNTVDSSMTPLSAIFSPEPIIGFIPDPDYPEDDIAALLYEATPPTFTDYYKPLGTLLSPRHNMSCSYWKYYYNSDLTKIISVADYMAHAAGTMMSVPMTLGPIPVTEPVSCMTVGDEFWEASATFDFIFPGTTYTLQDGVPIPGYPTKKGALVFDLQLKRWGKYKGDHKALVEYAPINSVQNAVIPYTNFGMDSGILQPDGTIRIFSALAGDSYIRYGKIGYYRFGVSRLMEVRLHFRTKSTGKIVLDASLEGRKLDTYLQQEEVFTEALEHTMYCDINAKWFTISIHGQFDLQYAEFRGNMTSRR